MASKMNQDFQFSLRPEGLASGTPFGELKERKRCQRTTPPIFKLHTEILWHIFSLNSHARLYIEEDSDEEGTNVVSPQETKDAPLIFLRRASHVCRPWREVILNSPSIWASSLDLQFLNQKEDYWRNEVLKRAGDSPLTLVGRLDSRYYDRENPHSIPFALSLLEKHWDRVRALTFLSGDPVIMHKLHAIFSRPAPSLEQFHVVDLSSSIITEASRGYSIFSGQSPRLVSFSCDEIPFQFAKSWSSNIRHFRTILSSSMFTALELLRGLEEMPLLTTLEIESFMDMQPDLNANPTNIPTISLPFLNKITVFRGVGAIVNIVSNIKASHECVLRVVHDDIETLDVAQITTAYTKIFKNNFNPPNVTIFLYSLTRLNTGSFELKVAVARSGPEDHFSLDYVFQAADESDVVNYVPCSITKALSHCDFSSAKTLALTLDDDALDTMTDYVSKADVTNFFNLFKSIKMLRVDENTLKLFHQRGHPTEQILFPRLKYLHCDSWTSTCLSSFATRHDEIGYPIKAIVLIGNKPAGVNSIMFYSKLTMEPWLSIYWENEIDDPSCQGLFVAVEDAGDIGSYLDSILSS